MGIEEKTLCVKRNGLPPDWLLETCSLRLRQSEFSAVVDSLPVSCLLRGDIEWDARYKQIIPYVLACDASGRILTYQRHGTEQRFHGLYSLGIEAHVNDGDRRETVFASILSGTSREVREELGATGEPRLEFLGVINEERTRVGNPHLGAVFRLDIDAAAIAPDAELSGWRFRRLDELEGLRMELWSELALRVLKGDRE